MSAGLKIQTAAGVMARHWVGQFFSQFGIVIRYDRHAARTVIAAFVDALAGAAAYAIQGRHGTEEEITEATVNQLRDAIKRDLKHLRTN